MRKLVYVILATVLVLGLQLLPARRAEANNNDCSWLCCLDDSPNPCVLCCPDGPCPQPTCLVG